MKPNYLSKYLSPTGYHFLTFLSLFTVLSCTKIQRLPVVTTKQVTDITTTSAKASENLADKGDEIVHYGHSWTN